MLVLMLTGAETPAPEDADAVCTAVARWIELLEAPTLAERSRAERELLDLGPKVLPWLPPNDLLPGITSREAVQRLRIQLQRKLARDSARPSHVTLSETCGLQDLATEIARQTANPVRLAENLPTSSLKPRTWTLDRVPFWEAIDSVCDEAKLRAMADPETDGLLLTARPDDFHLPAVSRAGVLRAELSEASRQTITGDATRNLLRLRGELAFEPRLRPLFVHFKAGDFTSADRDGTVLESWNPQARYELPMTGAARRTKIGWDFVLPADAAPRRVSLRGKLIVQLAAATEQIRFEQLAGRKEVLRRRGGVSVRLHRVEFTDGENETRAAKLRVTVNYDAGGPAFESHRTWVYHNAAWMEDDRRRYPLTDFDTLQQTDGSVQLEYRFHDLPPGDSLKFVYEAPTLLLDVPFDIEFSDIAVR